MKRITKRALALLLTSVMFTGMLAMLARPVLADDSETDEIQSRATITTIEEQIRAFAQSINKTNADDTAATALAKQGLTGGGKKLSVGKSHALTATLWNSEMMQAAMTVACSGAIEYMHKLDIDSLPYVRGFCRWKGAESTFNTYVCTGASYENEYRVLANAESNQYTGTRNSYDSSLEWMAGVTALDISIKTKSVTADAVTYSVTSTIRDRFDFDTSQASGFNKLITGLGALLFQEFDWESTVTFTLTVPYSCPHSTQMYHFTYDAAERVLISDNSDGYTSNAVTRLTYKEYAGDTTPYYHELESPIRLYHNKPWVMEYTIRNLDYFVIAPLKKITLQQPCLMNYSNSALMYQYKNIVDSQTTYNCYGIRHDGLLNDMITYKVRLENVIDAKGSNMVYLTVFNTDNQSTVLSTTPMDDYYENVNGVLTLKDSASNYLNGVDLFINYIGNKDYAFHADYFDLKVWENGIDGGSGDYFASKVTKPTCSARGYTTHTCACCGYSYKDTYTAKTEHKFDAWNQTTAPTCLSEGVETRTCSGCGTTETRAVDALDHAYTISVTEPNCTEQGFNTHTCTECGDNYVDAYVEALGHDFINGACSRCEETDPNYTPTLLLGDVTGDGKVTSTDYSRLLAHVKKVNLLSNEEELWAADVTGDGNISATDYSRLLAHVKKVNLLW